MSLDKERGDAALRLKNDETFQDVCKEVRDAQTRVFLNPDSSQEEREEAHVIIRALGAIDRVIDARIANGKIAIQKGQHRG